MIERASIGYVKLDYNETIGIAADDEDSLGEGLRDYVLGIYGFIDTMRERFPGLVIEDRCSEAQRLEVAMIGRTDLPTHHRVIFNTAPQCGAARSAPYGRSYPQETGWSNPG